MNPIVLNSICFAAGALFMLTLSTLWFFLVGNDEVEEDMNNLFNVRDIFRDWFHLD